MVLTAVGKYYTWRINKSHEVCQRIKRARDTSGHSVKRCVSYPDKKRTWYYFTAQLLWQLVTCSWLCHVVMTSQPSHLLLCVRNMPQDTLCCHDSLCPALHHRHVLVIIRQLSWHAACLTTCQLVSDRARKSHAVITPLWNVISWSVIGSSDGLRHFFPSQFYYITHFFAQSIISNYAETLQWP